MNATVAWAILVFAADHYAEVRKHGSRYVYQFRGPNLFAVRLGRRRFRVRALAPLMVPIELLLHLARVLTLSLRLAANMFADHSIVAAHNGVPSLSVLDGWWVEGPIEGMTGWSIGREAEGHRGAQQRDREDAAELYDKLERVIVPLYYRECSRWIEIMRQTSFLNASFFHAHRMMLQYTANASLR